MREVHVKGQTLQFPDGMSDEQIDSIVKRDFFSQSVAKQAQQSMDRRDAGGDLPPGYTQDSLEQSTGENFAKETPLGQFALGAGQGAMNTAHNISKFATGAATGDFGPFDQPKDPAMIPQSPMGKAGYAGEQIGEYFAPGAAGLKVAAKAPLLARAGMQALTGAGVGAAQGANPIVSGAAGAGGEIAAAGVANLAPRVINSALNVPKKLFRTGANAGEGVVNEGVVAGTWHGALDKVESMKDALGKRIGMVLNSQKANNITINLADRVHKPIDDAIEALDLIPGSEDAIASLQAYKQGLPGKFAKYGASMDGATPAQAFAVKKALDKSINHLAPEGADASTRQIIRKVRRNISQAISDAFPTIKPLNDRYADLAAASDAIRDKITGTQGIGGSMWQMMRSPLAYLGAPAAYAAHSPGTAAAVLGASAALRTPLGATGAAQALRGAGNIPAQIPAGAAGLLTQNDEEQ